MQPGPTMSPTDKAVPKLSLLAQFDDFCRQTVVDDDEEILRTFLEFVRNQEVCRQRWEAAEKCVTRLAEESRSLTLANSELQEKLQHMRVMLKKEAEARLRSEARVEALLLQLDQVRSCVFSRSFRNREHQMIRVLRNILGRRGGGPANTTADKSVQSTQSSPKPGQSMLSGDGGAASREASRGEERAGILWDRKAQSLPGTPKSCAGTRRPFRERPVPAERTSVGSVSTGADPARAVSDGLGSDGSALAGAGSVGFCFTRHSPVGDASGGIGLTGRVLAGAASSKPGFAGAFSESAAIGTGFAGPLPTEAGFAGSDPVGAGFAASVPIGAGFAGPAPVRTGSAGHGAGGPWAARPTFTKQSSRGPGSAPAKLSDSHKPGSNSFCATSSRKTSSPVTGSCATSSHGGKVFATTMTMVAGEPGYVATVSSQMDSNASTLSSQQTQQSFSELPAFSVQRPQKTVPKEWDESQLEQESGFFSRLAERSRPRRSTSTPVDMSPPPPSQQSHVFTRRPAPCPETCAACGRRIRFYKASLCCEACNLVCHPECQSAVCLPCKSGSPLKQSRAVGNANVGGRSGKGTALSDYTPSKPPLVPLLMQHCIQEVERRVALERGPLYGSAVTVEEVDLLLGTLLNRSSLPALGGYSLPVVCGALVTFLASLRETVITKSVWLLLAKATEEVDAEKRLQRILDAVCHLPAPNRATLSVLLLHLHLVSTTSLGGDGRSLDDLATVFAPLVVGYSESDPNAVVQKREKSLQELIMHCLLGVPEVHWKYSTTAVAAEAGELNGQQRAGAVDDRFVTALKEGVKNRLRSV